MLPCADSLHALAISAPPLPGTQPWIGETVTDSLSSPLRSFSEDLATSRRCHDIVVTAWEPGPWFGTSDFLTTLSRPETVSRGLKALSQT